MPFQFQPQRISEVILVEPKVFGDDRGFFKEMYKQADFVAHGVALSFVQDNYSRSQYGVLRGLHYQKEPYAQGKLVTAVFGEIFDVAVDIRQGSPTYGQWIGVRLSADNHRSLYVPPGFAHGFCVLSERADVLYKVTAPYAPEADRGIRWDDPEIGVEWPITDPVLSSKDVAHPPLARADNNFVYNEK